MSLQSKINNGTITIRDINPEIRSEGIARSNGYVLFEYRQIVGQLRVLADHWPEIKQAMEDFDNSNNYFKRLVNTRAAIQEFVESRKPEPTTS